MQHLHSPPGAFDSPHSACISPDRGCNSPRITHSRPHRGYNIPHSACAVHTEAETVPIVDVKSSIDTATIRAAATTSHMHHFEPALTTIWKWRIHFYLFWARLKQEREHLKLVSQDMGVRFSQTKKVSLLSVFEWASLDVKLLLREDLKKSSCHACHY